MVVVVVVLCTSLPVASSTGNLGELLGFEASRALGFEASGALGFEASGALGSEASTLGFLQARLHVLRKSHEAPIIK